MPTFHGLHNNSDAIFSPTLDSYVVFGKSKRKVPEIWNVTVPVSLLEVHLRLLRIEFLRCTPQNSTSCVHLAGQVQFSFHFAWPRLPSYLHACLNIFFKCACVTVFSRFATSLASILFHGSCTDSTCSCFRYADLG